MDAEKRFYEVRMKQKPKPPLPTTECDAAVRSAVASLRKNLEKARTPSSVC